MAPTSPKSADKAPKTGTRWTQAEKEHAYALYERVGSLRATQRAMATERGQRGDKPPKLDTVARWAKQGKWQQRRVKVQARMEAKTEESLAQWRARRAAELDEGLDLFLKEGEGKRLAALIAKHPSLVAKLLEVADHLRGGGTRHEVSGPEGKPLPGTKIMVFDVSRFPPPAKEDDAAGQA